MPDDPYLRLSTWNVEWAAPGTPRGRRPHPLAGAGDLNQRSPRTRQPHEAFDLLVEAFRCTSRRPTSLRQIR